MEEQNTLISLTDSAEIELRPIEVITAEIMLYKQHAAVSLLEIGRRLNEAKAQLSHGEWGPWLEHEVEFSEATARRFMRLAREYENQSLVTDLGTSKALILLALPPSEREEFASEMHLINGEEKSVYEMSKRELETAIKEREEVKAKLIRLEADHVSQVRDLTEKETAAQMQIAELTMQLDELKNAPPVVTTVTETVIDRKAVDDAVAQTTKEYDKKLKTAERDKESAVQAKKKAERELNDLKVRQEEQAVRGEAEKKLLTEELDAMRKRLTIAASQEITMFKLHFEQVQSGINKMSECVDSIAEAGDAEQATKLKTALRTLLQATLELLEDE